MAAKGVRKILGAWVAPTVTFLVFLATAWFLVWYWLANPSEITPIDPQIAASLPNAGHVVVQTVPGMRLGADQFIISLGARGPWDVRNGIYRMNVVMNNRDLSYSYVFAVALHDAYTGDDLKLVRLVQQLVFNPFAKWRSGADPHLIEQLRTKYVPQLQPHLVLSDEDQQTLAQLWLNYALNLSPGGRPAQGAALIQALGAAGQNSQARSQAAWQQTLQEIRLLIPPDAEENYLAAISGQTIPHPAATQPTQ